MADVTGKVQQIRQAVYGKDVRESIASGIETMNSQLELPSSVEGFRKVASNTALIALNTSTYTELVGLVFNVTEAGADGVYSVNFDGTYTFTAPDTTINIQAYVDGILYKTYIGTFGGHFAAIMNLSNLSVGSHTIDIKASGAQTFAVGSAELAVCL